MNSNIIAHNVCILGGAKDFRNKLGHLDLFAISVLTSICSIANCSSFEYKIMCIVAKQVLMQDIVLEMCSKKLLKLSSDPSDEIGPLTFLDDGYFYVTVDYKYIHTLSSYQKINEKP